MTPEEVKLLQDLHASCRAELDATIKINIELCAQIEKLTKPNVSYKPTHTDISDLSFTLENKVYGFKRPAIMHKGQKITPVEVMADEALQKELILMQSGLIYLKN